MSLSDEFRKLWRHEVPTSNLLVPLYIWCSGYRRNIKLCQSINKQFFKVNKEILIKKLALGNKLKHFIKYPRTPKKDEKTKFFYDDVCKYYGWTVNELNKNINVINIEELKPIIAQSFGYDPKERKILKLKKIKVK